MYILNIKITELVNTFCKLMIITYPYNSPYIALQIQLSWFGCFVYFSLQQFCLFPTTKYRNQLNNCKDIPLGSPENQICIQEEQSANISTAKNKSSGG